MDLSLTPAQIDLITGALSFFFTIALLSYLIGDNPLYRVALHLFIGVSAGYAVLVIIYQVLRPRLVVPLMSGDMLVVAQATVSLMLFVFLIMKLNQKTSALGNISVAYMIGVGSAVALGGALTGTLLPQIKETWLPVLPASATAYIENAIIVLGTITTLMYFQFWLRGRTRTGEVKRTAVLQVFASIGQGFLVITLGAIYGGLLLSGIAILNERIALLYSWVINIIS